MSELTLEDVDVETELGLLEAQGASSDKYYAHSTAHSMAFQKYASAAKMAQETGNAAHAKMLRKVGKQHKKAAEALAAIGGSHVDHMFSRQQAARKAMPAKLQEGQKNYETAGEEAYHVVEMHPHKGDHHLSSHSSMGAAVGGARHKPSAFQTARHPRFIVHEKPDGSISTHDHHGKPAPHYKDRLGEETEMTDETNPIQELIGFAIQQKAHQFNEHVQDLMRAFVAESVERTRRELFEIAEEDEVIVDENDEEELTEQAILEAMSEDELDELEAELDFIEDLDEEAIDELFGKGKLPAIKAHHDKQHRIKSKISQTYNDEYDRSGDEHDLDKAMEHGHEAMGHDENVHRAKALQQRAHAGDVLRSAQRNHKEAVKHSRQSNPDRSFKYRNMKNSGVRESVIDELSVPPTGKTVMADPGASVGEGDQGPRTLKKVKFSKKKPEQKSVSVSPGDKFREQEAAD